MSGLFRDIQSYFDGKHGGKYLAILLRELARHEPQSFRAILQLAREKTRHASFAALAKEPTGVVRSPPPVREFRFDPERGAKSPRADLALLHAEGNAAALFEIKDFDNKNATNLDQLNRYLKCAARGVVFIHISRFHPEAEEYAALIAAQRRGDPVVSLRFRDLHAVMPTTHSPVAEMLRSYLEDINVGIYKQPEPKALILLLQQLLGFRHSNGMGTHQSDESLAKVPETLRTLYDNVEYLGELVRNKNQALIQRRFSRRLFVQPWFAHDRLRKALRESGSEVAELPGGAGKYVERGVVFVEAWGRLQPSKQYVCVGQAVEIRTGDKKMHPFMYAYFTGPDFGAGGDGTYEESEYLAKFPTEESAEKLLRGVLRESVKSARALAGGSNRKVLNSFNPLS
ncbi:hypothetical protein ACVINW_001479 [Bradyrhizobium sp. USDA 4461]